MPIHIEEKEIRGISLKTAIIILSAIISSTAFVVVTYFTVVTQVHDTRNDMRDLLKTMDNINSAIKAQAIDSKMLNNKVENMDLHLYRYDIYFQNKGWMLPNGVWAPEK